MTKVEILAVGSELLTPFFQDTNSLFVTRYLNDIGLEVQSKTIVGDEPTSLLQHIRDSLDRADIIFLLGGLGPTEDDRSRESVAEVLGRKLVFSPEVLERIERRFQRRGIPMPSSNRKQAYILEGAQVLENEWGTAPGLWIEDRGKTLVLLPGPPQELQPMFQHRVLPRLVKTFPKGFLIRGVLKTTGLTESQVEDLLAGAYPKDPALSVTTLARPGQIDIHLIARSACGEEEAENKIIALEQEFRQRLGEENVFSRSGEELEEVIGRLLREKKKTVSCAESCTGGPLCHRLTHVPGSSEYFYGGVIAYSNEAKVSLLGVSPDRIKEHGAVSAAVAEEMASGIRRISRTDYALAITGIAGPGGGTPDKPVGLVYITLEWDNGRETASKIFLGTREQVRFQSSQQALDMLRRHVLKV